jgi:hypothetical protein
MRSDLAKSHSNDWIPEGMTVVEIVQVGQDIHGARNQYAQ